MGVSHRDVEGLGLLQKPSQVLVVVGGVGHRQERLGAQAVGEEVVEDAAVLAAEDRVLRAAGLQLGDVVAEDALQERLGLRARRRDLAHMGDVEDARGRARGQMLGLDATAVLDGHLPARERDELGPGGDVPVVERGALERGIGGSGGHAARLAARRADAPRPPLSPCGRPASRGRGTPRAASGRWRCARRPRGGPTSRTPPRSAPPRTSPGTARCGSRGSRGRPRRAR